MLKVVLIIGMFGEISTFHFIELSFWRGIFLDTLARRRGKCVFVIFRIKMVGIVFSTCVYFFILRFLLLLESEEHHFWKVKNLLVLSSLWKGKLTAVEYYSDSV